MSKKIKLKDLLNENFSGAMMGGLVSRSAFDTDTSLSKMVNTEMLMIKLLMSKD
jgi:hypothetical protein